MESIVEFALYTWVAVSVLAVLVQLVRIFRYRRANGAVPAQDHANEPTAERTDKATAPASISLDLEEADATSAPKVAPAPSEMAAATNSTPAPVSAAPGAPSLPTAPGPPVADSPPPAAPNVVDPAPPVTGSVPTAPPDSQVVPSAPAPPVRPAAPTPPPTTVSDVVSPPTGEVAADSGAGASSATANNTGASNAGASSAGASNSDAGSEASPAETATLADLLAGVRLPWNLLPTVDHSRSPSNDHVVLMTADGEPADVGADVADELERLGFSITTRGEDIAVATRGDDVLGLQIIPNAADAMSDDVTRFPSASATSVALDIWIEH